jgi:hypothetical protein
MPSASASTRSGSGGDELEVPGRDLGVESAARAGEESGVRQGDRAALDDDAFAARVDQAQHRLEQDVRDVGRDRDLFRPHPVEHAGDLGHRVRNPARDFGRRDDGQTLKLSRVSRANSSSGAKRRLDRPCSW